MRVLVVEDHPIYSEGLRTVLKQLDPTLRTTSAACAEAALRYCLADADYDLCVVDMTLPGIDGVTFIESLVERDLYIPVVLVSADEDAARIARAMEAGALGFIPKSLDTASTLDALRRVLDGHVFLPERVRRQLARLRRAGASDLPAAATRLGITPRQYRVLQLVADGLSNAQIASVLNVTEHTVKSHVRGLFQALDAENRTACVQVAARQGLVGGVSGPAGRQAVDQHP